MNNEQILKKAIEKAMGNGWGTFKEVKDLGVAIIKVPDKDTIVMNWENIGYSYHTYSIIFSHDFAKTIWGEEKLEFLPEDSGLSAENNQAIYFEKPVYFYHLQQMVLEKEPLKYIEKFL